ncbi:MAG: ABC transporter permease [Actinobacteria bacterium]|nr:MAG: ABC transporter permease [Actinomycetota bacterium]
MLSPVWIRARHELRARWRSWLGLALVVGIGGGVVLAALAGARRTEDAYPRLAAASNAADVLVVGQSQFLFVGNVDLNAVDHLPEVASTSRIAVYLLFAGRTESGRLLGPTDMFPIAHGDAGLGNTIERWKMLAGRPANPERVDEATASFLLAERLHLRVGATLRLRFTRGRSFDRVAAELLGGFTRRLQVAEGAAPVIEQVADGPLVTVKIVGIEASPAEFPPLGPDLAPPLHLTPAFFRLYQGRLVDSPLSYVRLKRGAADLPAFQDGVDRLAKGQTSFVFTRPNQTAAVQRAVKVEGLASRLLAALTALALLVIVGQALTRQTVGEAGDHSVLRAMGMTSGQLTLVALVRGLVVAGLGSALALGIAFALSPLSPVGLARTAEITPGVAFDGLVLGVGGLVLIVIVGALTLVAAWRASRLTNTASTRTAPADERPSRVAESLTRTEVPPTAVVGVRFALEPGRGATAVPVRTTMLGVAVVVALLTATWSFAASLHRLLDTPVLYGWNWDIKSGAPGLPGAVDLTLRGALSNDHAVGALAVGTVSQLELDRHRVDVLALEQVRGEVVPTVVSGRPPGRPGEVLLGARTLHKLHKRVGDSVTARLGRRTARLRVVGRGVFPDFGDAGQLGDGALTTFAGLADLLPSAQHNVYLARFRPGVDAPATYRRVRAALAPVPTQAARRPSDLTSIARVDSLPGVLAGVLALLAAVTLAHTLVSSVRRRRRDLAVLKTLGFVRRQVSFAVVWQATTLSSIALLIGVPLGTAGGRWAWTLFTTQLGVSADAVTPPLPILLTIPATLVAANAIAALPAWAAGRSPSALILRTE